MVKREEAIDDYPHEQRDADVALDRYWEALQSQGGSAALPVDDSQADVRDEMQLLRDLYEAQQVVREDSLAGGEVSPPVATGQPAVGSTIGEYELLSPVGSGGMGTVYRARHQRLGKTVALKLMGGRFANCEKTRQRFEREMQACGRLEHANIVRATDAGEFDGQLYLVMEFVDGIDLASKVRCEGPLPVAEACRIARKAAIALDYVHQNELVHRDVKPSNLMLTTEGEVKLLDLGLAQFSLGEEEVSLTATDQLVGTLDYMAPETVQPNAAVDHRADIYSLGATLYKLLAGRAPHNVAGASSPVQKLQRLTSQEAPSIAEQVDDLPPALVALVDKMLAKSPHDRVQTATEVADALARIIEVQPPQGRASDDTVHGKQEATRDVAKPAVPQEAVPQAQAERPPRRRNHIAVLTAIAAGCVAAALAMYLATNNGTIVIESPHDDVEVRVRKGERVVKRLTLHKGENATTIYAGEYEIDILGPQPEQYDVDQQRIQLRRGDNILVTITEEPAEVELALIPPSPDQPWGELIDDFKRHQQVANWLHEVGARLWITRDGESMEQFRAQRDGDQTGYRIVQFAFPVGRQARAEERIAEFRSGLKQLKGLASVQSADVTLRELSDAEVKILASLPDLHSLVLSDATYDSDEEGRITIEGMAALGRHGNLTLLDLSYLPLGDALIEPLQEAKQLQRLNLRGTQVGNEGMKAIGRIAMLEELNLSRTKISATGLSHLTALKGLRRLDLQETHVGGDALVLLAELPKLQGLKLSSRSLNDSAIPHVAKLPNLEQLSLGARFGAELTDNGLQPLVGLRKLKSLSIHSSHVDGSFLGHLGGLPELEELDLLGCPINDAALDHLKQFPKLRSIDLRKTNVTDAGLRRIRELENIETIQAD